MRIINLELKQNKVSIIVSIKTAGMKPPSMEPPSISEYSKLSSDHTFPTISSKYFFLPRAVSKCRELLLI